MKLLRSVELDWLLRRFRNLSIDPSLTRLWSICLTVEPVTKVTGAGSSAGADPWVCAATEETLATSRMVAATIGNGHDDVRMPSSISPGGSGSPVARNDSGGQRTRVVLHSLPLLGGWCRVATTMHKCRGT